MKGIRALLKGNGGHADGNGNGIMEFRMVVNRVSSVTDPSVSCTMGEVKSGSVGKGLTCRSRERRFLEHNVSTSEWEVVGGNA